MAGRSVYLIGGYFYGLATTLIIVRLFDTQIDFFLAWLVVFVPVPVAVFYGDRREKKRRANAAGSAPGRSSEDQVPMLEFQSDVGTTVAHAGSLHHDRSVSSQQRSGPSSSDGSGRSGEDDGYQDTFDDISTRTLEQRRRGRETPRSHRPGGRRRRDQNEEPAVPASPNASVAEDSKGWPEALLLVWRDYWMKGDGHFNSDGLRTHLAAYGLDGEVVDGTTIGANDSVLIVEPRSPSGQVYLLPSFTKPPRAVQEWFEDTSGGALTGRTQKVLEVAVGRRKGTGFEIVKRGTVS